MKQINTKTFLPAVSPPEHARVGTLTYRGRTARRVANARSFFLDLIIALCDTSLNLDVCLILSVQVNDLIHNKIFQCKWTHFAFASVVVIKIKILHLILCTVQVYVQVLHFSV